MKRILLLTFAFALTACAAQPVVAPTATVTLRPTSTLVPTETPIPSATATVTTTPPPTETAPLTLADVENGKFGDFTFTNNGDETFSMIDKEGTPVPDLKLFKDGTVELTYGGKNLKVAFEAIKQKDNKLIVGFWDYKDNAWTMAKGFTAQEVRNGQFDDHEHKLVVIRSHSEEGFQKEMALTQTIFDTRDFMMDKTEGYKPEDEFKNITIKINGEMVEHFDDYAKEWKMLYGGRVYKAGIFYFKPDLKNPSVVAADGSTQAPARPLQPALLIPAYFPIEIIKSTINQKVLHVPLVAKEDKFLNLSALVNIDKLFELTPFLENNITRADLFSWIIKGSQPKINDYFVAIDPITLGFVSETNKRFFDNLGRLPSLYYSIKFKHLPEELKTSFFTFIAKEKK